MATEPNTQQSPKTYVLFGADFEDIDPRYKDRDDVIPIRATPGQSIEDAVKDITPPANIILAAHGPKRIGGGVFLWNGDEILPYSRLFAALPREGIGTIQLESCFGGSAEKVEILRTAPVGSLVQTMVGSQSAGDGIFVNDSADKTRNVTDPVALYLRTLSLFEPQEFKTYTEYYNNKKYFFMLSDDSNPQHAIPHIIGLGGNPPRIIDLQDEAAKLPAQITSEKERYWKDAIEQVKMTFDTDHMRFNPDGYVTRVLPTPEDQRAMADKIDAVSRKIRAGEPIGKSGDPIADADEQRIACALTASYLDKSGQIERWKQEQVAASRKQSAASPSLDEKVRMAADAATHTLSGAVVDQPRDASQQGGTPTYGARPSVLTPVGYVHN